MCSRSSPASTSTTPFIRDTKRSGEFPPTLTYLSLKELKMDPAAAKLIGAGGGVGIIFGNYLAAAVRNPSAAQGQFGNLIFGFAVTEALGIFSLLIALLLLFVPL